MIKLSTQLCCAIFFCAVLLSSCGGSRPESPEALGKAMLEAVKSGDRTAIDPFLPTKSELLAAMEASEMPDEEKANAREEMDEEWPEMEADLKKGIDRSFERWTKATGERELDMSQATYVRTEANTKERRGLFTGDFNVIFTIGEGSYTLHLDDCIKLESGWSMSPDGYSFRSKYTP